MGVTQLGKIIETNPIEFDVLNKKIIAIDAYNSLYQFLATIRQATDGTPLTDQEGRITSHLKGLFNRTIKLIELGIKPVYVFDGPPLKIKQDTLNKRMERRNEAKMKYEKALEEEDYSAAKKYAQAAIFLNKEMVEESKHLLHLMGVPIVEAISEGEAQAAYMTNLEKVWASSSQDWDSLLFGSQRLIRNLTITGIRRTAKGIIKILPEMVELKSVFKSLGLTREQLIDIGILVGNDYNEGIKGIGPKNALKYLVEYKSIENFLDKYTSSLIKKKEKAIEEKEKLERLIKTINDEVKLDKYKKDYSRVEQKIEVYQINMNERIPVIEENLDNLRNMFLNPEVKEDVNIEMGSLRKKEIFNLLVKERNFNNESVMKSLKRLEKHVVPIERKTLDSYFS
ncbi:MAG: flap endonuclease-1 [Candidatus Lokiarchaeota archaeon]|nr:flap endonuclease-1 [Candidatus Lokiarchaeota archaeon]